MGFNYYEMKQGFLNQIDAVVTSRNNHGRKLSLARLEMALSKKFPFGRAALMKALQKYETAGMITIDENTDEITVYSEDDGSSKG